MTSRLSREAPPGMATALNAIRNTGRPDATAADVAAMLTTGRGDPTHLRTLFGDVSATTLMRLAIALDIETDALLASYGRARAVGAANPALDALLAEPAPTPVIPDLRSKDPGPIAKDRKPPVGHRQ